MKITIIAPNEGIIHTANEVLDKPEFSCSDEIDVVFGDLESGLEQAFLAIERGADVIISRGGTAALIARHVEIPVVEISVTAFDILRALKSMGDITGTVGVVFARRLLCECEKLGTLIGVNMREIYMENEKIEQNKILAAQREGITIFLGDAVSVRLLMQQGIQAFPIDSTEESILKAIVEAAKLADVRRREQEKAELYRSIINYAADGIISIDKTGHVTSFNPVAEKAYQICSSNAIGKYIGDIIPDDKLRDCLTSDKYEREDVKIIGSRVLAIKRIPIKLNGVVVGAIAHMQDVTQLQRFEQVVRQKLNKKGLVAKFRLEQLTGSSKAMNAVKERAIQYSGTDTTVLITGESGTGKELIAQSIHNLSRRKNGPFVAVNCAALPENLLESELFGYEEGAFTGAKRGGKSGLFELAHGGTIFLDEIGEMPLLLQARLLRVLQEKEVMRLGADRVIPIDVRVLSATNQDLAVLADNNKFRTDLYYRLDVLRLQMPSLRERLEDIPHLINTFLEKPTVSHSEIEGISEAAIALLQSYPWQGNIRELENVIERVTLLAKGPLIEESDLWQDLPAGGTLIKSELKCDRLEVMEKQKIEQILLDEKFNYTKAAKRLGVSRTTLWRRIRDWKIAQ